jgi:hypothetical protein
MAQLRTTAVSRILRARMHARCLFRRMQAQHRLQKRTCTVLQQDSLSQPALQRHRPAFT